jgi:hypothetical protein
MARTRAKRITSWLEEMAGEPDEKTGKPRNQLIAKALYDLALDDKQPAKLRLEAIEMIADRTEGKPVQTNVNAEMQVNPFVGIDTTRLEALKDKLLAIEQKADAAEAAKSAEAAVSTPTTTETNANDGK